MKLHHTITVFFSLALLLCCVNTAYAAKNVILVIGDGMGPQQLGLLSLYARLGTNDYTAYTERIANEGVSGLLLTYPAGYLVTDSGASGTQMASGEPALPRAIGLSAIGEPTHTVADAARTAGKSVGIISDTRITHATPACFGAHWPKRDDENSIAEQLLESGADVMLSGGLRHWLPAACTDATHQVTRELHARLGKKSGISSARKDDINLLANAKKNGYDVVLTKQELVSAKNDKLLGLFTESAMPHAMQERKNNENPTNTVPSLKEMTETALQHLAKNTNGFFLIVEAGQIDWACHCNDAGLLLYEMIRLNDLLQQLYSFASQNDDTLLILTSDHETGGFSINYSPHNPPDAVPFPGNIYTNHTFDPGYSYQSPLLLQKLAQQKKAFGEFVSHFLTLPETNRTPVVLAAIVKENTGFPLSVEDAKDILTFVPNPTYNVKNDGRGPVSHPLIHDYSVFYNLDTFHRITALIARKLAPHTGISWSSGVHSHTPVPVISYGPEEDAKRFKGIQHTTDFGLLLKDCVAK